MAKQIYNYELFTNKKDELAKIRKKAARNRRIKILLLVLILAGAAIVAYILFNSKCNYYTYKDKVDTEDSGDVSYENFDEGYLKYSSNGIEYQKQFGRAEWNIALSYEHPFLAKSDSYAVLGDKGENTLILLNKNGKVREFTLKYPLLQATVSEQGIIEMILEGSDSNYVQVYGKNGKLIADMRSSIEEKGYPITAAISPNGTQLAVSYYSINGNTSKTSIAFYDLSRQLQSDSIPLKGGFDYTNTIIPKVSFMDDNTVAAFGSKVTYFYNIEDSPNPEKGKYILQVYNKKGARKLNHIVDMNYDSISMWGKEIIAVRGNECTIFNIKGNILFQGELEGDSIETIVPAKGWRTYHVVFRDKIVKMQLQFWKNGK